MDSYLAEVKELMDKEAEQRRLVAASEEILAIQVNLLRERVRNFEEEKKALLNMQRRQLRPGLVTMKMTARVQDRVNQLFGPGGKGTESSTGAPEVPAEAARSISELPPPPSPKSQNLMSADGSVPPMGFFRRPGGRQDSNTSSNMTLVASSEPDEYDDASKEESDESDDASEEDSDEYIDTSEEESEEYDDAREHDDAGAEESDVPTESSWASTIPP